MIISVVGTGKFAPVPFRYYRYVGTGKGSQRYTRKEYQIISNEILLRIEKGEKRLYLAREYGISNESITVWMKGKNQRTLKGYENSPGKAGYCPSVIIWVREQIETGRTQASVLEELIGMGIRVHRRTLTRWIMDASPEIENRSIRMKVIPADESQRIEDFNQKYRAHLGLIMERIMIARNGLNITEKELAARLKEECGVSHVPAYIGMAESLGVEPFFKYIYACIKILALEPESVFRIERTDAEKEIQEAEVELEIAREKLEQKRQKSFITGFKPESVAL